MLFDLSEWDVLPASTTLPTWVVEEWCSRAPEPFTVHASVYDGRLPQWVISDYLVESM